MEEVIKEVYYLSESDLSDTDTYYSEEEDILCGFVKETDSTTDSERDIPDKETQPRFSDECLDFHGLEQDFGIHNIKQKDSLKICPETQRQHLKEYHPELIHCFETLNEKGPSLAYVSPSILSDLQPKSKPKRPHSVIGDVSILSPQKPVMCFTLLSSNEKNAKVMRYNTKTARAFRCIDTDSKMLKDDNPITMSMEVSQKDEYPEDGSSGTISDSVETNHQKRNRSEEDHDLECDGHPDDHIQQSTNIGCNIHTYYEHKVDMDTLYMDVPDVRSEPHSSTRRGCGNSDYNQILEVPLRQHCDVAMKNVTKITDVVTMNVLNHDHDHGFTRTMVEGNCSTTENITRKNGDISYDLHLAKTHTASTQDTCIDERSGTRVTSIDRKPEGSPGGLADAYMKSDEPKNSSITRPRNPSRQEHTSECLDVDHDVLKDISVISAALTKDEWNTPERFLRKVQELEALAREVELPDSLEMGQDRYVRVVRSFYSRLSAAHRLYTSCSTCS